MFAQLVGMAFHLIEQDYTLLYAESDYSSLISQIISLLSQYVNAEFIKLSSYCILGSNALISGGIGF